MIGGRMAENEDLSNKRNEITLYETIKHELTFLGIYLERVNRFLEEEIKKELKGESVTDEDGYPSSKWITWEVNIVQPIRISFIMLLFSFIESNLDQICDLISERKHLPISRQDLSGGVLASAKKYFKVFGNFNHDNITMWPTIEGLYDVRNIFSHAGGNVLKSKLGSRSRLNNLLKMDIGLSERNDCISITNNRFCDFALDSTLHFFDQMAIEHVENFVGFWVVK
jgi:hypothetical protein